MPMRRRDHVLRGVLEQHAAEIVVKIPETHALAREVARAPASRMAEGDVQIETVARALATSTRSLQRRLAEAGLSFLSADARKYAPRRYERIPLRSQALDWRSGIPARLLGTGCVSPRFQALE